MTDVDGIELPHIHATAVMHTKLKILVNLQAVDGTPSTANVINVQLSQQKPYAQMLNVNGAPTPAFLVSPSIPKQLAYLQGVVGSRLCANLAKVAVTP